MELYGVGVQIGEFKESMPVEGIFSFLQENRNAFKEDGKVIGIVFRAADVDVVRASWFADEVLLEAQKDGKLVNRAYAATIEELEQVLTDWNALTVEQVRENRRKDEEP